MLTATADPLPRILLVEDSNTSTAIVTRLLRDQFEVRRANDGMEAWDILCTDDTIELVLTDVEMPRLNGHELLRKIRTADTPRLQNLAVIVMTTTDNDADRRLAFAHGASDFVGKPLEPPELQARVRLHQRLAASLRELEIRHKLSRDLGSPDLTRLKNRSDFSEIGRRSFALAKRHRQDLAMLKVDIDQFEEINRTYGRHAGERVLVGVAQTLASITRAADTPARLGGKEFAVLLPKTDKSGARFLAERLRQAVERSRHALLSGPMAVTASVGVASFSGDAPASLEQLIEFADKRLHQAKQRGRNSIVG